jgi:glyoxylase-like metal-dependent hydrolase (beta-lactamase superfamily II)
MDVSIIETSGLGDRSYLVSSGGVAVVIDPQRDIDRVLGLAEKHNVRITHVAETHLHNDYITGGLQLSRTVCAEYQPGHTHNHVSYVLRDDTDAVYGVFTGGSMLYGTTGRTDLISPDQTEELSHAQYNSVHKLASRLPPETPIYPTHGFGSFCSATPASGDSSTIGEQRSTNPALTQSEQDFVEELLAGLSAYPA